MNLRLLAGPLLILANGLVAAIGLFGANVTVPLGLQPIVWPPDNPYTPEKAELGRLLYFDPRLSADGSVACATCHAPNYAFADALPVSSGVGHQKGTEDFTIQHVAKAIATFERTVLSGNSPYDRYQAGNKKAMTPSQVRGLKETPTLRDVAETPPYMHDGMKTLREVVDFYDKGGTLNKNLDKDIKPLKLTSDQRSDLVEFLRPLSGDTWQTIKAPDKFPE